MVRSFLIMAIVSALAACTPYKPTLHLDDSPSTIPVEVVIQPLRDLSPPDDREHPSRRTYSLTSRESLEGELSVRVTRAIAAEFSATSLFRLTHTAYDRPDLVIGGTVHRFYGYVTLPSWTVIPGLGWIVGAVWAPVREWSGEVDLELTVSTPAGRRLGAYRGQALYHEVANLDSHHWSTPLYPAHARLNRAFTEAVQQIRDQMLRDRERLIAGARE